MKKKALKKKCQKQNKKYKGNLKKQSNLQNLIVLIFIILSIYSIFTSTKKSSFEKIGPQEGDEEVDHFFQSQSIFIPLLPILPPPR